MNDKLTPLQKHILTLFTTGHLPDEEIAWQVGVDPADIEGVIRDLYRLLGVTNRCDALLEAERLCGFNARKSGVQG